MWFLLGLIVGMILGMIVTVIFYAAIFPIRDKPPH